MMRSFATVAFISLICITIGLFTKYDFLSFNSIVHVFTSSNESVTYHLKHEIAANIYQNSSMINILSHKMDPFDFDHLHLQDLERNNKNGVHTFHYVCLEASPGNPHKRIITVYNADKNITLNVHVATGPHVHDHLWPITFTNSSLPQDYTLITNHSAFFVKPACESNLFHFWEDCTIGLYGAMKATNRLNSSIPNQLFYNKDVWRIPKSSDCDHNPAQYEQFLFALSIKREHISYHRALVNICYQNATFGFSTKSVKQVEVMHYLYNKFRINLHKCKHPTITIQQRKSRKIMNAEVLKQDAIKFGWTNTDVISFGDLSLVAQLQTIACTDVLVGVQGAGLEWLYFMRPNTSLLELAWPQKHWHFYYKNRAIKEGMKTQTLQATNVILNLDAYVDKVRLGKPLSDQEKDTLQTASSKSAFDNHWKWANGIFDPKEFVQKLQLLLSVKKNPIGHT